MIRTPKRGLTSCASAVSDVWKIGHTQDLNAGWRNSISMFPTRH